nr:hypothetical protein [uncultured Mailhella sp.]
MASFRVISSEVKSQIAFLHLLVVFDVELAEVFHVHAAEPGQEHGFALEVVPVLHGTVEEAAGAGVQ